MPKSRRIHRHLYIEELEPRIAPEATVNIIATDPTAIEPPFVDYGVFTISRGTDTTGDLTVLYTVNGSATYGGPPGDYVTTPVAVTTGSITIGNGQTSVTITVIPSDDTSTEGTETVILTLSTSGSYSIGTSGDATVSIWDNDGAAPTGVDLLPAYDTGISNADDITYLNNSGVGRTLGFFVSGAFTTGSTVWLIYSGQTIGEATVGAVTTGVQVNSTGALGLPDGIVTITARHQQPGFLLSGDSPGLTITIDSLAPTTPSLPDLDADSDTGRSNTDNVTSDNTPTINLSGYGTYYHLYRATTAGQVLLGSYLTSPTYTDVPLVDGVYTYRICAVDVAGNTSGLASLTITIDKTPPPAPNVPDLTAASDSGLSNSDNITTVSKPVLALSGYTAGGYYRLFRNAVQISGDYSTAGTFTEGTALSDGAYTYVLYAVDLAGNVSGASPSLTITIDTTPPSVPNAPDLRSSSDSGVSDTDNITNINQPTFDLSGYESYYRLYRGATLISGSYGSASSYTEGTTLGDGVYTYTLRAVDAAGNVSGPSAPLTITIDTVPPAVPSAPALDTDSDSGISSTDNLTNIVTPVLNLSGFGSYYRLYRNAVQISDDYATAAFYTEGAALGDGVYTYTLRAVDAAGNISGFSSALTITIDTIGPSAPDMPDLDPASDSGVSDSDNLTNDTTPTLNLSGFGTYYRLFRDGTQVSGNFATAGSFTESTPLPDGTYTYRLYAVDPAGNLSPSSPPLTVGIDTTPPAIPDTPDLDPRSDSGASNSDNITNDTTPTFILPITPGGYYRLYRNATQIAGPYATAPMYTEDNTLGDGVYNYTLRSVDAAGNVSGESTPLTVTIDTMPPILAGVVDLDADSDTGVSNTDNITKDNTPTLNISGFEWLYLLFRDGVLITPAVGSTAGQYTEPAPLPDGVYVYTLRSVDLAGNTSGESVPLAITIDTTPPPAPNAPDLDPASDTGVFNWDNITTHGTPTLNLSGFETYYRLFRDGTQISGDYDMASSYTEATTLGLGIYSYTLRSVDAAGNVSDDSSPLWISIVSRDIPLELGKSVSFTDGDGSRVTVLLNGAGAGVLTLTNGLTTGSPISWIVLDQTNGKSTLTITSNMGDMPGTTFRRLVVNNASTAGTEGLGTLGLKGITLAVGGTIESDGGMKNVIIGDIQAGARISITGLLNNFTGTTIGRNVLFDVNGDIGTFKVTEVGDGALIHATRGIKSLTVASGLMDGAIQADGTAGIGTLQISKGGLRGNIGALVGDIKKLSINGGIAGGSAIITGAGSIGNLTVKGDVIAAHIRTTGLISNGAITGNLLDATVINAVQGLGRLNITGGMDETSSITFNGGGRLSLSGSLAGLIQTTASLTGGISVGQVELSGIIRIGGDSLPGAQVNVARSLMGTVLVEGDLLSGVNVKKGVTADGYINAQGIIGPGSRVIINEGLAGIVVADAFVPGYIKVNGATTGEIIWRAVPKLLMPSTLPVDMSASPQYGYRFRGYNPSIWVSGPTSTPVELYIMDPAEGIWSIKVNGPLNELVTTDVVFREIISNSTINTTNIMGGARWGGVQELIQMAQFDSDDRVTISGSLKTMTVLNGDFAGKLTVSRDIAGGIQILDGNISGEILARDLVGIISASNDISGSVRITRNMTGTISAGNAISGDITMGGTMGGSIIAGTDLSGQVRVVNTYGAGVALGGVVAVGGDISGAIVLNTGVVAGAITAGDISGSINVAGDLTGYITTGQAITGAITIGSGVRGQILAGSDLQGVITIGTGGIAEGALIGANESLSGLITVQGDLAGTVHAGQDLSGVVSFIGASVTTSGRVEVGRDLSGAISSDAPIAGQVVVGGALTGRIHTDTDMAGSIFIGSGGIGQGGQITANGDISGNVTIEANVAGTIRTLNDLSGAISIGGGVASSGFLDIQRHISATGFIDIAGNVAAHAQWRLSGYNPLNVGAPALAVGAGDFNGDNIPDLAVSLATGYVAIYLGNGNGWFRPGGGPYPVSINPANNTLGSITVGNINSDGYLDIAVANYGASSISILYGNGNGTFRSGGTYGVPAGFSPTSIVIGQINGDGIPDLAVTCPRTTGGTAGSVFIFLGATDGTFTPGPQTLTPQAFPSSAALGYFNADANLDLAVTNRDSDSVSIFVGNGNGTFLSLGAVGGCQSPSSIVALDVVGTTSTDLVVANSLGTAGNYISVFQGNGNGTFRSTTLGTPSAPSMIVPVDWNLDGRMDLFMVSRQDRTAFGLINQGNGRLVPTLSYPAGANPSGMAVADFNGDGIYEMAVSHHIVNGNVSILHGDTQGQFFPYVGLETMIQGDINEDGKVDLVGIDSTNNRVSVLLGNGNATFQTHTLTNIGTNLRFVTLADLNNDNHLDLVVTGGTSQDSVYVLLGNGDGTYQSAATYSVGVGAVNPSTRAVSVADFNSDNIKDLIVANSGLNSLSLLLGNGDGSFQTGTTIGVATGPWDLAVGDMNGDGKLDVAITIPASDSVSVLIGNGNGTFRSQTLYPVGHSPNAIAMGDVNGDGKPDLVVGNRFSDTISLLLGNGNGTFSPSVTAAFIDGPMSLWLRDMNSDSRLDLLVPYSKSGTFGFAVCMGNGNGTFQSAQYYSTNLGPDSTYAAAADFNGDGIWDVIVGTNPLSVLLGSNYIVPGDATIRVGGNVMTNATEHPDAIRIGGSLLGLIEIAGTHGSGAGKISIGGTLSGQLWASLFGNVLVGSDFTGLIHASSVPGVGYNNRLAVLGAITGIVIPVTPYGGTPPVGAGLGDVWAFDIVQTTWP